MEKFKLFKEYHFSMIEKESDQRGDVELIEYGPELIGEFFLTLKDDNGNVISFILTGCSNEYIMACVYTDF